MNINEAKELILWHGMSAETLIVAYQRGVIDERERCIQICNQESREARRLKQGSAAIAINQVGEIIGGIIPGLTTM